VPLADLFLWGTPKSDFGVITEALYTGPQRVGGVCATISPFRQPRRRTGRCGIERGKNALPRKLIVDGDGCRRAPAAPVGADLEARRRARGRGIHVQAAQGCKRIAVKEMAS